MAAAAAKAPPPPAAPPTDWQPELRTTWQASASAPVTGITLSCKGAVAVSTPSSVLLFDPPPALGLRKELRAPDDSSIRATTFSCKGTDVVSGGSDGFVKWWQVDSGEEVCATQFPQAEGNSDAAVQEVACSKAGFVAAVSGRFLCLFGAGGEHLHTLGAEGSHSQLQQLTWLGDSEVLACSGDEVTVWSVSQDSYKEVHVFAAAPKAAITHLAASPNGRYIAAAFDGGQLQVWDTQREDTMDPLFNISEGIEAGQIEQLAWDANSKLLAAAAGNEIVVWDLSDQKDDRIESYVCMGYEQGAHVKCLAFQPTSNLLASAADNGQCLVHDVSHEDSNGIVDGLINHVAAANVSEGREAPDAVRALVWHPAGVLLLGTESGALVGLQASRVPAQRKGNSNNGKQYKGQDVRRQANGPDAPPGNGSSWNGRGRPQGWGGEPLTNSEGIMEGVPPPREPGQMGARGRGSGGRDGRMPPGSYPGGYRQRDVPMSPAAAGEAPGAPQESPTVMPVPWGMVPAGVPGMHPLWMRPMPGMAMPYAIPYQQMYHTAMAPVPAHLAAQGMYAVPTAALQPSPAAAASARYGAAAAGTPPSGGGGPGGSTPSGSSRPPGSQGAPRGASTGGGGGGSGRGSRQPGASYPGSASSNGPVPPPQAGGPPPPGVPTPPGGPAGASSMMPGQQQERRQAPPPGPAPPSFERGMPPGGGRGQAEYAGGGGGGGGPHHAQSQQQPARYSSGGWQPGDARPGQHPEHLQQQRSGSGGSPSAAYPDGGFPGPQGSHVPHPPPHYPSDSRASSEPPPSGLPVEGGGRYASGRGGGGGGVSVSVPRGFSSGPTYGGAAAGGPAGPGPAPFFERQPSGSGSREGRYGGGGGRSGRGPADRDRDAAAHHQLQQQVSGGGYSGPDGAQPPPQQHMHPSAPPRQGGPPGGGPPQPPMQQPQYGGGRYQGGAEAQGQQPHHQQHQQPQPLRAGSSSGYGGGRQAAHQGPAGADGSSGAGAAATPRSPAAMAAMAAAAPAGLPAGAVMMAPRPMMAAPVWMYPQAAAAGQWGMAYPQHWATAPYFTYAGYPAAAYQAGMAQHPAAVAAAAAATSAAAAAQQQQQPGEARPAGGGKGRPPPPAAGEAAADGGSRRDAAAPGGREGASDSSGKAPPHMGGGGGPGPRVPHQHQQQQQHGVGGMPLDPDGNRALYVGNLAPDVDEQALHGQFAPHGHVMQVQVMRDRETHASRGFAFVTFATAAAAQAAMAQLNGASLPGPFLMRPLRVSASNKPR